MASASSYHKENYMNENLLLAKEISRELGIYVYGEA
jgi:hypothetical protein